MHPRNRYNERVDFASLSASHPPLKDHLIWKNKDYATLDFKNREVQRELTRALLHRDFNLEVHLPKDKLIPTVPQKLNYIHWIEDLLAVNNDNVIPKGDNVRGIDTGTGASGIYPLLGCRMNEWRFLATEIDNESFQSAKDNVERNHLQNKIKVLHVPPDTFLVNALDETEQYSFSMCNPPFYQDTNHQSDSEYSNLSEAIPKSGQDHEIKTFGGEANFVKRIIEDSILLQRRVRWYTTLLGKKSNLKILKAFLRENKVPVVVTTTFVQGKTWRWGIGWSFEEDIKVPLSRKQYTLELELLEQSDSVHCQIQAFWDYLEITYSRNEDDYVCTTTRAVWSNQRRKRRAMLPFKAQNMTADLVQLEREDSVLTLSPPCNIQFKCSVSVVQKTCQLTFTFILGQSPDHMHHIMQYIRNHWNK